MTHELSAKFAEYGVPKGLIRALKKSVRKEVTDEMRAKLDAAERSVLASFDEAMQWRFKHNIQQENAQKFELQIAVSEQKLKLAHKAVTNMAAYCKKLRHQIFGDKSERGASTPTSANPAVPDPAAPKRGKKPGSPGYGRKRDDADPKPINHDLDSADKVCQCGSEFELTDLPGVESYETHYVEHIEVRKHIRRKCIRICRQCGRQPGMKTAKAPDKIIPKGKYSVEFWRFLLEEKFWLQRPLNRTREKLKWLGATVRLGTITNGLQLLAQAQNI